MKRGEDWAEFLFDVKPMVERWLVGFRRSHPNAPRRYRLREVRDHQGGSIISGKVTFLVPRESAEAVRNFCASMLEPEARARRARREETVVTRPEPPRPPTPKKTFERLRELEEDPGYRRAVVELARRGERSGVMPSKTKPRTVK